MPDFTCLLELKKRRPLIHCISNLVSANDCANVALAVGASPMMAQAPEEIRIITAAAAATVLNTGTPDAQRFEACRICAETAAKRGAPVVLDPVGVGASPWRLEQVNGLLHIAPPSVLRANLGEARALLGDEGGEQGVDSPAAADRETRLHDAAALAEKYHTAVLLSGAEDLVTDGERCFAVTGGSRLTASVTGTGCMLSVLCGAFAAVAEPLDAALLASVFWKLCAARAEAASGDKRLGAFHTALIDAAGALTPEQLAAEGLPLIHTL
jgi:hydroxyethylthiazole kinase